MHHRFGHRFALISLLAVGSPVAAASAQDVTLPSITDSAPITLRPSLEEPDASDIAPASSTIKGAIADSLRLLMIEHGVRISFQEKTRRELGGAFLKDYVRSIRVPRTWEDGDSWLVNYLGHPVHGAASGFIWLDHVDGAHDPDLGFAWDYWKSRGQAAAWIAIYSYQFEFGPLSEASIGNVGLRERTTGWVDHVVTPVGGLGILVAEDALDKYLIRRVERWTTNRVVRGLVRTVFNPGRTLSNTAQGRLPWYRVARPITAR